MSAKSHFKISYFCGFVLLNFHILRDNYDFASATTDQAAGLDVVTWVIAKCSERNIGIIESIQALESTGKCIEAQEPDYLKSMSSETPEERLIFRQAAAKEVCNTWLETKKCLKPLVKLLESCFDRRGVILNGLDILYCEFCLQEDEMGFIEMATQMTEAWDTCLKKRRTKLISKYELCMEGKGDVEDYICRDYEFAVECAAMNFDSVCPEMDLGFVLRHFFGNKKVRKYFQTKIFLCTAAKTEL